MTGASPGFVSEAGQDYHLISSSPAIDDGAPLNPAVLPTHDVVREYVKHLGSVAAHHHQRDRHRRLRVLTLGAGRGHLPGRLIRGRAPRSPPRP